MFPFFYPGNGGLSARAIAGIVVGILTVLALINAVVIIITIVFLCKHNKGKP